MFFYFNPEKSNSGKDMVIHLSLYYIRWEVRLSCGISKDRTIAPWPSALKIQIEFQQEFPRLGGELLCPVVGAPCLCTCLSRRPPSGHAGSSLYSREHGDGSSLPAMLRFPRCNRGEDPHGNRSTVLA